MTGPDERSFHEITRLTTELVGVVERSGTRFILGVTGPPGAGKSTVAHQIADVAAARVAANVAPMDGFHRSNADLEAAGLLDLKGVPESFDAAAFVAHVRRLRQDPVRDVMWPTYDRSRQQVVPGGTVVGASDMLVVVEGNYLLLDQEPWSKLRPMLDAVWYLDVPDAVIEPRLLERQRMGRDEAGAARKVATTDLPNAALVATTMHRADVVIRYEDPPAGGDG